MTGGLMGACGSDAIYSDWAVKLLLALGRDADRDVTFGTKAALCDLLGLADVTALSRALAPGDSGYKQGGKGWPNDFDPYAQIRDALLDMGRSWAGPRPMMKRTQDLLALWGVRIDALDRACEGLGETWGSLPRDDAGFVAACDQIAVRCNRRSSAFAGPGAAGAGSALALVPAVLRGRAARAQVACVGEVNVAARGGAVDVALPASDAEIVWDILPDELRELLEREGIDGQGLLGIEGFDAARAMLVEWLCGDAGGRFAGMVGTCRRMLTAVCDEEELCERVGAVFDELEAAAGDEHSASRIARSRSAVRFYARGDAPRVLAAFTLALVCGPDRAGALECVFKGKWGL